jgi:hypothetical protein
MFAEPIPKIQTQSEHESSDKNGGETGIRTLGTHF